VTLKKAATAEIARAKTRQIIPEKRETAG